jgi:modulator of FtsH protease
MQGWENFLVAEVGASAALTGLIFVGVSINLKKILSLPTLPNRALEALLLLLTVLVVSSLLLVPGQSNGLAGCEVTLIGMCVWLVVIIMDIVAWRNAKAPYRRRNHVMIILNQLALLPYLVGGITIAFSSFGGPHWLVPAMLLSFVKAIADAWVLLVEINR